MESPGDCERARYSGKLSERNRHEHMAGRASSSAFYGVGVFQYYLHFYLCMAIGGQWPQNRLLASAAAYLILNTLLQFVMMFGMITAALAFHFADMSFFRGFQSLAEQSPALFIYSMLGIGAG